MGKIYDIKSERSRPANSVSYGKYDFDTICAGLLFLIQNSGYFAKLYKFIDADYFYIGDESPEKQGLRVLIKLLHDMRRNPEIGTAGINITSVQSIVNCTSDSEANAAARSLYEYIISNPKIIEKSTDRACQYIFLDYLRVIQIVKWSEEFMPRYKSGDIENATKTIKDLMGKLNQIRFNDLSESIDTTELTLDELGILLSAPPAKNGDLFLLGHDELDIAIGGFERRTLNIFIGPTNCGKSQMTHHLIRRAIAQHMTVHVAIVEDRPKSVYRRLYAALTGIPVSTLKMRWETLTTEQKEKLKIAQEQIKKYVKIDFLYGEALETIHQKKIEYDMDRIAKGLKPYDVDIIDYTGHVAETALGDKMYEKFRNAFAARKDFCLVNNKIGFDFAQVNRAGFQKKQNGYTVNHGDLAGAFDLSQVCDNIISINRTPEDEKKNTARLVPSKLKDGELRPDGFEVRTQFECARWIMNDEDAGMYDNTIEITEVESKPI